MRFPTLLLALASVVFMTGCSSLISLNPFVTDQEAVTDAGLPGIWNTEEKDGMLAIRQDGSVYTILYAEGSSAPMKFEGRLFKAGDAKFLDLIALSEDPFQIPAHVLVRVWPEGSTLRFTILDTDWLRQQAKAQLPNQVAGDRTLMTAPGSAIRAFALKYGVDDKAYSKKEVLHRAQ